MPKAVICHKYKFIYCPIPKNACTSVLYWILQLEGDKIIEKKSGVALLNYIHTTNILHRIEVSTINNPEYSAYYKFIIVRNPLNRVLSAYNEKFIKSYQQHRWVNSPWKEISDTINRVNGITFIQFLNYIEPDTVHKLKSEPHWRSQFILGGFASCKYDKVIHFENLNIELNNLYDKLCIPSNHRNIRILNQTTQNIVENIDEVLPIGNYKLKNLLPTTVLNNKDIHELIMKKYHTDFKRFY